MQTLPSSFSLAERANSCVPSVSPLFGEISVFRIDLSQFTTPADEERENRYFRKQIQRSIRDIAWIRVAPTRPLLTLFERNLFREFPTGDFPTADFSGPNLRPSDSGQLIPYRPNRSFDMQTILRNLFHFLLMLLKVKQNYFV